jgi:hypothetical protein
MFSMIFSDWTQYAQRLYANQWFALFPAGDPRRSLAWGNRLQNFGPTDIYNLYSSGDQVLRRYDGDPPPDLLSGALPQAKALIAGAKGSFAWVWQEKAKGRASSDDLLGSTHGGWQFNYWSDDFYITNAQGIRTFMSPADTSSLTPGELQTNSFFNLNSTFHPHPDSALLNPALASGYAQTNRNRILSDAIPALTLPVGANALTNLDTQFGEQRNFNMQTLYENGWPSNRMRTPETNNWHHSDFREVAFTYTYKLFDKIVTTGNLK